MFLLLQETTEQQLTAAAVRDRRRGRGTRAVSVRCHRRQCGLNRQSYCHRHTCSSVNSFIIWLFYIYTLMISDLG